MSAEDLQELMLKIRERCEKDTDLTERGVVDLIAQGLRQYRINSTEN